MEIVFLNTFNGKIRQPIEEFIASRAGKTDIFCLQEAYSGNGGMGQLAVALLPGYQPICVYKALDDKDDFPQATFVHRRLQEINHEVLFPNNPNVGLGIATVVEYGGNQIAVCNFHGRSKPGHKLDTPDRLAQSRDIIEYFATLAIPLTIIGGDFNTDLDTEAIRMFNQAGYRNLITEYGIRTTRNRLAWEKYPNTPQLHSDYVFVRPSVQVISFEVIDNEISDHLPLILKIE